MRYAEVLLPQKIGPRDKTLTYEIPSEGKFLIGQLVEVSLRNKMAKGIIYEIHDNKPSYPTKQIHGVVPHAPHLSPWQIELMKWIAEYYFTPLYKTLRLFLPATFVKKRNSPPLCPWR